VLRRPIRIAVLHFAHETVTFLANDTTPDDFIYEGSPAKGDRALPGNGPAGRAAVSQCRPEDVLSLRQSPVPLRRRSARDLRETVIAGTTPPTSSALPAQFSRPKARTSVAGGRALRSVSVRNGRPTRGTRERPGASLDNWSRGCAPRRLARPVERVAWQ